MSTPRRSQNRKSTTINLDDDSDLDMSLGSIHDDSDDSWSNEGERGGGGRKGKKVVTKTKKKTVTTKKTTTATTTKNLPGSSTNMTGLSQSSVAIKKTKPVKILKEKVAKAKKATTSTNSQDCLVSEALECIICLEFAASPIHNCANGHITCGICVKKLPAKKCSMCKAKLTLSIFGERLAKKLELTLKCDFADEGCKEMVKSTELKKHLITCAHRNVKCCQEQFEKCVDKSIPMSGYVRHLNSTHGLTSMTWCPKWQFKIKFQKKGEDKQQQQMPISQIVTYKGRSFIRMGYRTKDTFYTWMAYPGSKSEADKFGYVLKIVSQKKGLESFSWSVKLPVFPIHSEFGYKKPSPLFAAFPISVLANFGSPIPVLPFATTEELALNANSFYATFQLDMVTIATIKESKS